MGCVVTGFVDNVDVGGVSKDGMESAVGIATGCTTDGRRRFFAGPPLSTVVVLPLLAFLSVPGLTRRRCFAPSSASLPSASPRPSPEAPKRPASRRLRCRAMAISFTWCGRGLQTQHTNESGT